MTRPTPPPNAYKGKEDAFQVSAIGYIIDGDTHIGKWVGQSVRLDHDQNTLPLLVRDIRYWMALPEPPTGN